MVDLLYIQTPGNSLGYTHTEYILSEVQMDTLCIHRAMSVNSSGIGQNDHALCMMSWFVLWGSA